MYPVLGPSSTRTAIDDFLAHPRIALVGLSRDANDFSRVVYTTLRESGFDIVPVNPEADEIAGEKCFESVTSVSPPVAGALVMTPADATLKVVEDCERAGVRRVWMHRGGGRGAVSPEAVEYCLSHGMSVVPGQCPLMFVGGPTGPHKVHAAAKQLWGTYPRRQAPPASLATLAYGAFGWLLCGLAMYAGMAVLSMTGALVFHALVSTAVFALLSARYHKVRPGLHPMVTAATFAGTVFILDVVVVALLIENSFAMFASPLGTWIPLLLIFAASWAAGELAPRRLHTPAAA